ncbi:autotransporter domain-containing protein [Campylobacter coli]|nr:autotransporter domain-containing protein [Campylobacter coli]EAI2880319.1 autotransporter domain-containing protein [Campylobacter jejuni]EAI9831612.1 autotransporter domain-containing protein [Campylobacter coli]EGK7612720.1 S8 family serine peptidase [Campylobacter coli]EIQ8882928.1 S8 family serine peptidase [Campylobacter coli]
MKNISFLLSIGIFTQAIALSDFELINVSKAHDQGITGQGIIVGVIDSPINQNHPDFKGKILDQSLGEINNKTYTPDFNSDVHGSHVAGIIGAKRNNASTYGVAYDAKIYGLQVTGANIGRASLVPANAYEYFKDKDVKIINNSWGSAIFPVVGMKQLGWYSSTLKEQKPNYIINTASSKNITKELIRLSKEKQVLMVFASHNQGISSPDLEAVLPYYDESLKAWLSVGSLDSSKIYKNSESKLVVEAKGLSDFGNAFIGAENFSLVAPGSNINSINASYGVKDNIFGSIDRKPYRTLSGTSMAAPMVSGAAALVSQKFPFLNGKQIADILLSTANKNYQAPKLTVKVTKDLYDIKTHKKQDYYTIIYIDQPVPDSKEQIKQDLKSEWYFDADKILNNLISSYTLMKDAGENYEGIQSLSKEALFGQGILDVTKALGGIATLDANRLEAKDVNSKYNNEKEAYYSLDTKGYNATFSNDISQKLWDDKTHLVTAKNSARNELKDIQKIGILKTGDGILILSGNNSYKGTTLVEKGEIALHKQEDKSGGIIAGDVKVLNTGLFSGNGTINQNLHNEGIVRPGNKDLSNLTVKGSYTQTQKATLQLDFGNSGNSKLIANSYDIQGGKLEYIPLPQFYTSGTEVNIDLGSLNKNLDQFTEVKIASNNSVDFIAVLDKDKTNINKKVTESEISTPKEQEKNTLPEIKPSGSEHEESKNDTALDVKPEKPIPDVTITQPESTKPEIPLPEKQEENTPPQTPEAKPDDTNLAKPVIKPIPEIKPEENKNDTSLNDKPKESISAPDNTIPQPQPKPIKPEISVPEKQPEILTPEKQEENTPSRTPQTKPDNTILVKPVIKPDAYNTSNTTMGAALRNIRSQNTLKDSYKNYFTFLDSTDKPTMQKALKSLESIGYIQNFSELYSQHYQTLQHNMLFALNPSFQNDIMANLKSDPILLAYNPSDAFIDLGLSDRDKKYIWYLSPNFKKIRANDFDGQSVGLNFTLGGNIDDTSLLTFSANVSDSSFSFENANFKNQYFNLSSNYVLDLQSFKILSSASIGIIKNDLERQILLSMQTLNANYNSILNSLQLGLAKDFDFNNITLTPLIYFNYNFIRQNAFDESDGLFAKSYEAINHHSTSLAGGLNFAYLLEQENLKTKLSSFFIYEYRLSGKNIHSKVSFKDFPDQKFMQYYNLHSKMITWGISSSFNYPNSFFVRFNLINEFTKNQYNINFSTDLGFRF